MRCWLRYLVWGRTLFGGLPEGESMQGSQTLGKSIPGGGMFGGVRRLIRGQAIEDRVFDALTFPAGVRSAGVRPVPA